MSTRTHTPLSPSAPPLSFARVQRGVLQRKCACGGSGGKDGECEECKKKTGATPQRRAVNASEPTSVPPIVHEVLRSPGQPLDAGTREFFEPRFGHDFSRVRVHTDAHATESARELDATAYTVGRDIVFGSGQYRPGTSGVRVLFAHELTHVVQQERATGSQPTFLRIGQCGDPAENEADRVTREVARGHSFPSVALSGQGLQRQGAEKTVTATKGQNVENLPVGLYVDAYESIIYNLSYRSEKGGLSKWMKVRFSDGNIADINIDSISDETTSALDLINNMFDHKGLGGRIYPKKMNKTTTPRLWSAKREVLKIMDDYNALFILMVFPTVWMILTMAASPTGEPPTTTRRAVPRGEPATGEKVAPPEGQGRPSPGGESKTQPEPAAPVPSPPKPPKQFKQVPETGKPGNQRASVRAQNREPEPEGRTATRAGGPWRGKPVIKEEEWAHIDARHVRGNDPEGPGDLFAAGTTRPQLQRAAEDIVDRGVRISDPGRRLQTFERRITINGQSDRVRVVVDTADGRVITMFPVRGGG